MSAGQSGIARSASRMRSSRLSPVDTTCLIRSCAIRSSSSVGRLAAPPSAVAHTTDNGEIANRSRLLTTVSTTTGSRFDDGSITSAANRNRAGSPSRRATHAFNLGSASARRSPTDGHPFATGSSTSDTRTRLAIPTPDRGVRTNSGSGGGPWRSSASRAAVPRSRLPCAIWWTDSATSTSETASNVAASSSRTVLTPARCCGAISTVIESASHIVISLRPSTTSRAAIVSSGALSFGPTLVTSGAIFRKSRMYCANSVSPSRSPRSNRYPRSAARG